MPEESNIVRVILRLFDTLKEAINDSTNSFKSLQDDIRDCIHRIDLFPLDEIKTNLNNHRKDSNDNANKYSSNFTLETGEIKKKLDSIETRIKNMIIVVITAFSLFSVGIFITNVYMKGPTSKLEKTIVQLQTTIEKERQKTDKIISDQDAHIKRLEDLINNMNTP